jgi:hypothetical protein
MLKILASIKVIHVKNTSSKFEVAGKFQVYFLKVISSSFINFRAIKNLNGH